MNNKKKLINELYQAYLADVYTHSNDILLDESKALAFTYGEMLYPSVNKVLKVMQPSESDVFLDLGAGLGKFALQVFMQSEIKMVLGIEILPTLTSLANQAIDRVKEEFAFFWQDNRTIEILSGDFLKCDWRGATIIYSCSTCFDAGLLENIGSKINHEKQIKQVFSLRPIPTLTSLRLKQVFTVECSWDSALCYHYSLPS